MANGKLQVANPKPHQRLEVWQQAMLLVKEAYSATASFPKAMLGYLVVDHPLNDSVDRVGKLLSGFSKKLKTDVTKP